MLRPSGKAGPASALSFLAAAGVAAFGGAAAAAYDTTSSARWLIHVAYISA